MEQIIKDLTGYSAADNSEAKLNVARNTLKIKKIVEQIKDCERIALEVNVTEGIDVLTQREKEIHKHKERAHDLQSSVNLLRRATNLKFTGPNSGVFVHHGKAKRFTIPLTTPRQEVVDQLWKLLEQGRSSK